MALVQTNALSSDSATSIAVSFISNVTINDLLIAVLGGAAGVAFGVNGVTDSQGNVWTLAVHAASIDDNSEVDIWYAIAKTTGANTVTWNAAGAVAGTMNLIVAEYSDIQAAPLDQTHGTTDSVGSSISTGNVTTTHARELLIGVAESGGTGIWSADSGFTNQKSTASSTDSVTLADNTVTAIGTYSTNLTQTGAANRKVAAIASFIQTATSRPTKLEIALFGVKRFGKMKEAECHELPPSPKAKLFQ